MKKFTIYYLLIVLVMFVFKAQAQGIKEFYIECDAAEFESMYENYEEEIFIPILLSYDGNTWIDVRMRIRGDSSKEYPKKSLKVVFDETLFIDGIDVINLNAEYHDQSYLHSVLSSRVFNDAGIECVNMEHIRLYLNGDFFGLYVLTENVDEYFLESRGFNIDGNLYKATKDGSCLSIFDNVFYHWEKKLDNIPTRDDLAGLISLLNQSPNDEFHNFLQTNFNYSRITSFIALNMLLANGSTYYHNYYLYHNATADDKWEMFPWDLDRTFSSYTIWFPYHRSSGTWTADNPLLERSIIDDDVFNDIQNKLAELNNTVFSQDYLFPIIDSIKNVIEQSVIEDITDNIPDTETWYAEIEENKSFISDRYGEVSYQINNQPRGFNVHRLSGVFLPNEPVEISWNASVDPNGGNITYTLYYGNDFLLEDPGTSIIEGLTTTSYTINDLSIEGKYYYKVLAHDNSSAVPGFDTRNEFFINSDIPQLVINEINYNSSNDFVSEDWVEFYNPNETVVDLSDWYFQDGNNAHKFYFPQGTVIESKGFKILCKDTSLFLNVFPDTLPIIGNMDFGLSSSGELIRLYHKTGYLVDSLVYDYDTPWPFEPNGDGPTLELINPEVDNAVGSNWRASFENGTPGAQNSTYSPDSYPEIYSKSQILKKVYPSPFINDLTFEFELVETSDVQIVLYNLYANKVINKQNEKFGPGSHTINLETEKLKSGIYFYNFIIDGKIVQSELLTKTK